MRIWKKLILSFLKQLAKEYQALSKTDTVQAKILAQILEEGEPRVKWKQWEFALEYTIDKLYYYQIKLNSKTLAIAKELLPYTDKDPEEWTLLLDKLLIKKPE